MSSDPLALFYEALLDRLAAYNNPILEIFESGLDLIPWIHEEPSTIFF